MYPGSGPMMMVEGEDRSDFTRYHIDQSFSPYAKERKVTEENEFDEYSTGDPVMVRNEGPDGLGVFQYVYRNSGLEDVVRGSTEAFNFEQEEVFGEAEKKVEIEVDEEGLGVEKVNDKPVSNGGGFWGGLFGSNTSAPHTIRDAELDGLLSEAEDVIKEKKKTNSTSAVVVDVDRSPPSSENDVKDPPGVKSDVNAKNHVSFSGATTDHKKMERRSTTARGIGMKLEDFVDDDDEEEGGGKSERLG